MTSATTSNGLRVVSHSPEEALRTPRTALLEEKIRSRIEHRLGGRVRELSVSVTGKSIKLGGRCSTYYSKQLAQHAALGVIEDEQLANEILVDTGC